MKNNIIALVLLVLSFGTILSIFVIFKIKNSEAYFESKEFIENSEIIEQELGQIEGYGFLVSGTVKESRDSGSASLSYKITGGLENADIHINLEKDSVGTWKVLN